MNALPILLLGGAALMMMGGKKKPTTTNGGEYDDVEDDDIVIQTLLTRKVGPIVKKPVKKLLFHKATLLPKTGGGGTAPAPPKSWIEINTERLCNLPDSTREEQAKIYVNIALKGIRKAHDGRKSRKKLFPCNDKERLSWTVDEAFRLWVMGNPEATTTAKKWVYVYEVKGGELAPSEKATKRRPWNTLGPMDNSQKAEMSLTALSWKNGMRHVTDLHLNECAAYIRNLLTEIAGKKCGKEITGIKKIFPWNW